MHAETESGTLNPYVGLRPFERDDALLFFGRDAEEGDLLDLLHRRRFIAVLGGSGCGKSSLIQAGLIPKLKAGFLVANRDQWLIASMRPGLDPLGNLHRCLNDLPGFGPQADGIADALSRRSALAFWDAVEAGLSESGANLFLLVDQFEEIFRYIMKSGDVTRKAEARDFVSICLSANRFGRKGVYLALTMRSDFIGDCDQFHGLPEAINKGIYLVPRLVRDQFREAIEGPASLADIPIQTELINRILNGLGEEHDQLPIMQHLLMRMCSVWQSDGGAKREEMSDAHYRAVGTLQDALDRHATSSLDTLDGKDRLLLKRVFQFITDTDHQNRQIRRPMPLTEICLGLQVERDEVMSVVDKFNGEGKSFLIRRPGETLDKAVLDITHESLIRKWKLLQKWVKEEAENRDHYRRLCDCAKDYTEGKGQLQQGSRLALDLAWKKSFDPRAKWAKRYGSSEDFNLAMEFIRKSAAVRRNKRLLGWLAVSGVLLAASIAAFSFAREEKERILEKWETDLKRGDEMLAKATSFIQSGAYDSAGALLDRVQTDLARDPSRIGKVHIIRGRLHLARTVRLSEPGKHAFTDAWTEFEIAETTARRISDWTLLGQALQNKGSIWEGRDLPDSALAYYREAASGFKSAGELALAAYMLERVGQILEEASRVSEAESTYLDAKRLYQTSGDISGLTRTGSLSEKLNKSKGKWNGLYAMDVTTPRPAAGRPPWGYLRDLLTGESFKLVSRDIKVGRNTSEIKNDISFSDRFVSRKHLLLTSDMMASDLRSMNGTSLNGRALTYERDVGFRHGDIFVLAGRHVLEFSKSSPENLKVAESPRGIFITESKNPGFGKSFAYISGEGNHLAFAGSTLVLGKGASESALASIREGSSGFEIMDREDQWKLLFTVKESDYSYSSYFAKSNQWISSDTPLMFATLDENGQVTQEGPAFQIVPSNLPEQDK